MKSIIVCLALVLSAASVQSYTFLAAKWPGTNPVVSYWFNEQGCEDVPDEWEYLKRAFSVWSDVPTTSIVTQYRGTTNSTETAPDKQNVLKWAKDRDWPLGSEVIAVCYTWYQGATITDFDMLFNGRDYRWSTSGEAGRMDVGRIATHEAGHALGLDHSTVAASLMWPTASYADTDRSLKPDDSAGISARYPRTVSNNHIPLFTSTPLSEAIVGMRYSYAAAATDADGDSIRYSLKTFPLNMRIDSLSGLITWFPKFLDLGAHSVAVCARDIWGGTATQYYTLTAGDLVVSTPDTQTAFGDTVSWPVCVSSMNEYGIFAGNIELGFDPRSVSVLGIDTVGSIIAGATFAKNITADRVKVAFAGPAAFSGEGVLFRVNLLVAPGCCGTPISLNLDRAFFNDGSPVAGIRKGTLIMDCGDSGFAIAGRVLLDANDAGVDGARIVCSETADTALSGEDGRFALNRLPRSLGSYHLSAAKDSGDIRDAVSAFDAALILRHVVDLEPLSSFTRQKDCADVNSNALITAYDAALVLRFIVGIDDAVAIGRWGLSPADIRIDSLLADKGGVALRAWLVGDVSGNWKSPASPLPGVFASDAAEGPLASMSSFIHDPLDTAAAALPRFAATISLGAITEPVFAGEFAIAFDTSLYLLAAVRPAALLNGCISASNLLGDTLHIAFAGTEALDTLGELFSLELALRPDRTDPDSLIRNAALCRIRINEQNPAAGGVAIGPSLPPLPLKSGITGVWPNPFAGRVQIRYDLPEATAIRISVCDLKGRELALLAEGPASAGSHQLFWNGEAEGGALLSSQVCLLRWQTSEAVKTTKLYLLR